MMAAMSCAWHGIREEIFAFANARQEGHYDDALMREVIDSIDKGGCNGLLYSIGVALAKIKLEVMDVIGREAIDAITQIVIASLGDDISRFSQDDIDKAVSGALEWFVQGTFFQISQAFLDVLAHQTDVKGIICSCIESGMTSSATPESYEKLVGVIMGPLVDQPLQRRMKRLARGYWEVAEGQQIWIAAGILNHLSFGVVRDGLGKKGGTNPWDLDLFQRLITTSIELVREGIINLETKQTPGWKLSVRRAMYWCTQADASRTAWGSASTPLVQTYRNQDRWEESCVLMQMTRSNWPLF
jgi:hypothetical protein